MMWFVGALGVLSLLCACVVLVCGFRIFGFSGTLGLILWVLILGLMIVGFVLLPFGLLQWRSGLVGWTLVCMLLLAC